MIAVAFSIKDDATPAVQRVAAGMQQSPLNQVVGRSARNAIRTHLFAYNASHPNRLGGSRTNYYTGAARATQFAEDGNAVIVSINQVGMAQRYYGGTIKPKTSKYLTIPVHPAAHGHRAREFDLEVVFGAEGKPIALATKKTADVQLKQTKSGKVTRKTVTRFGEIYFRLVKSVTQIGDPTVLPAAAALSAQIHADLESYAQRIIARKAGGPAA